MTKFVNMISWCGVFQMATASSWNAGLDKKITKWYKKTYGNNNDVVYGKADQVDEDEEDCTD